MKNSKNNNFNIYSPIKSVLNLSTKNINQQ